VRAKAHKFEVVLIRLAVAEENEIRPDVTITVILPFAGQWVIEIPGGSGVSAASKLTTSISRVSSFLPCLPDFSLL